MLFSRIVTDKKLDITLYKVDERFDSTNNKYHYSGLDSNINNLIRINNLQDIKKNSVDIEIKNKYSFKIGNLNLTHGLWQRAKNPKTHDIIDGVYIFNAYENIIMNTNSRIIFTGIKMNVNVNDEHYKDIKIICNNKIINQIIKDVL